MCVGAQKNRLIEMVLLSNNSKYVFDWDLKKKNILTYTL